jgi:hypothetical protein
LNFVHGSQSGCSWVKIGYWGRALGLMAVVFDLDQGGVFLFQGSLGVGRCFCIYPRRRMKWRF